MSNPLDSDVQEDVRTFPMYQRLRKINPYAYYSLNTQKQMQSDPRIFGSPTFFEQDPDNLPELDESTDMVAVNVRLKPETRGVITAADLSSMRPDALFLNTSRAALIEPDALLAALNAGEPGRAAIDVFDREPITWPDHPLATHPNLICTPHIGYVTEDELELQFSDIFDQVVAYQADTPFNMINAQIWRA